MRVSRQIPTRTAITPDNTAKGEDASQGAVKTADESGILSWVILLGAAVFGFFGFRRKYNAGK